MSQSYSLNTYSYSDNVRIYFKSKILRIIVFVLLVLFVISAILMSTVWRNSNNISKIELRGNTTLSRNEIYGFAKLSDSILISNSLPLNFIEDRISKHPNVKTVNAYKESDKIIIDVTEKFPVCIVQSVDGTLYFMDDKISLCEFKKEYQNLDLPVVTGLSSFTDINTISVDDNNKLKIAHFIISLSNKIDKKLLNFISEICFSDTACITLYSSDNAIPVYLLDYGSLFDISNFLDLKNGLKFGEMTRLSKNQIININNKILKDMINEKLVSLNGFIKGILYYKGKNSYEYIDVRYKSIIFAKSL